MSNQPGEENIDPIAQASFTPLTHAVSIGDDSTVQFLLQMGSDPNAEDAEGQSALTLAVMNNHLRSAGYLLEYGADVSRKDSTGESPLDRARGSNNIALAALLSGSIVESVPQTRSKSEPRKKPARSKRSLWWSVRNIMLYSLGIVLTFAAVQLRHMFLDRAQSSIFDAVAADNVVEVGKQLTSGINANIKDADGDSVLLYAANNGKLDVVRLLLQNHADPNLGSPYGISLLKRAGIEHSEVVDNILDEGADANRVDERGRTLLSYACNSIRYSKVVTTLLKHRAKPDVAADNGTPLVTLIEQGEGVDPTIVSALLEAGANPNATDIAGTPVLVWAAESSTETIITNLLNSHASLNVTDSLGRTALQAAARKHRTNVVKLLLSRGANPNVLDKNGESAINWALSGMVDASPEALSECEAVIRALAASGAKLDIPNHAGFTPLQLAGQRRLARGRALLSSLGARR